MSRITGATFVIVRQSKEILMQLRDSNSKRYPNTWCFPGGTVESSENELEMVIREIKEEYELDVDTGNCKELMTYDLSYGGKRKSIYLYSFRQAKSGIARRSRYGMDEIE